MPQKRLKGKQLKALYRLTSKPMLDFDCGELCAPENGGVPYCCDENITVPLLFRDELRWHRKRDSYWRRMPRKTKEAKKLAAECEDDKDVLALCPGADGCKRKKRALVCRTFPFEPHCDAKGRILGLAFNYTKGIPCPLRRRRGDAYNPDYIRGMIRCWEQILEIFPEEKELYIEESRKLRKRMKRKGRKVRLFKIGGQET